MSDHDHYFTAEPASDEQRRTLGVHLAGRDIEVEVARGIFSPGGVDKGTAVLLEAVAHPPARGTFLDLGCGWGPLTLTMALHSPGATVYALDVNERALDLVRRTSASLGLAGVHAVRAEDVPADVRFDLVWSNPPIRVGKAVLHDLLRTWLPRLTPDGVAALVVQRNLGADSLQRWVQDGLGLSCTRAASSKGFRVLEVTHPVASSRAATVPTRSAPPGPGRIT